MPLDFNDLGNIVTPFRLTPYAPTGDIGSLHETKVQERLKKAELEEAARRRQAERDAATEAERGRAQRASMDSADRAATEQRLAAQFQLGRDDQDEKDLAQLRKSLGEALAQGDPAASRIAAELLRRHKSVGRVDEPSMGLGAGGAGGGEPGLQEPKATVTEGSEGVASSTDTAPEAADFDADTQTPDWVLPGRQKNYQADPQAEWNLYQGALDEMRAQNPGLGEDELLAKFDERQRSLKNVGDNVAPGQTAPGANQQDLAIGRQKIDQRRSELGMSGLSGGLGSGGLGGGEIHDPFPEKAPPPDLGIRDGRPPGVAPDALPEGWQAHASGLTRGPFGTQEETTEAPDGAPGKGEYIAYGKTGEVLFKVSAEEIRVKQTEMVNGSFDALADKEAAGRAKQSVLSRIGSAPLKDLVREGMQQYQFDVGQSGKDRRAVSGGGPTGPSLQERKFSDALSSDEQGEAWKIITSRIRQDSIPKHKEALATLGSIESLIGQGSGYADRTALKTQIVALEKRATDADMQIALNSGGLYDRIVAVKNFLLSDAELSPDMMKEVLAVAREGKRRILTTLKEAGDSAYDMAMNHQTIREENRQKFAGWVYGSITGDFSRMPKKPEGSQSGGAAPESDEQRRKRLGF